MSGPRGAAPEAEDAMDMHPMMVDWFEELADGAWSDRKSEAARFLDVVNRGGRDPWSARHHREWMALPGFDRVKKLALAIVRGEVTKDSLVKGVF